MDDLVIRMDGVGVRRGKTTLVADVNWSVELDERWVVLGPNGAGKTTLLKMASTEMHPSEGSVDVLGERLGKTNVFDLRPRIGLCSAALAARIPGDELVRDVVVSAGYSVLGRWHEEYEAMDTDRAANCWTCLASHTSPSASTRRCPRGSASAPPSRGP